MIDLIFRQRRAVNLFFFILFVLGFLSLTNLGTAELPEPPNSGLSITAVLPGASPDEVDKRVARLIQNAIKDISGIEEVTSQARESFLSMQVKFIEGNIDEGALAREVSQVISQVPDLPLELEGPFVSKPSSRIFPAVTLLLEGGSELERHTYWFEIEQVLKGIQQVEHIDTLGDRTRRIEIQLQLGMLEQLGLQINDVSSVIQKSITDQSAGRIESLFSMNRIRVKVQPKNVNDIKDIPINLAGQTFRLDQIAHVVEVLEPEKLRVVHNDNEAWYINIYRRPGSKISELSQSVNHIVEKVNKRFETENQALKLIIVQDRNFIVDRVLGELGNSIMIGMMLVVLVLWCFFGFHNALYAAIGIPFSFVATFIVMDIMGIGLNTFTLFGLVLVCGMIVDDSIVVLENICTKLEQGIESAEAIKSGLIEVIPAVLASTGTTIAAFLPLLLMTGGMGDFISQIPKVAILALVASLVECFVILPVHIYHRRNKAKNDYQFKDNRFNQFMNRMAIKASKLVSRLLNFPYRVLSLFIGLLFATGALAYFTMDFKMFDSDEIRSIRVHLTFPKTTDLALTSQLLAHKSKQLKEIPLVKDIIILNGWNDYNYSQENRSHLATIEVLLETEAFNAERANTVAKNIDDTLRVLPDLEKLIVVQAKNKPPVSSPVTIYLYGNDFDSLSAANSNVINKLKEIPSINSISNPLEDGIPERVFIVDEEKAAFYGLQPQEIAETLHLMVTGRKVAKIDRGDEIIDAYVLAERAEDWRTKPIEHLTLKNGDVIPLSMLGRFEETLAPNVVRRFKGNRYIQITADIDESIMSNFKTHREIQRLVTDDLLPLGVSFEQLGEFSSTQKSLTSMFQSAFLSLGLVYLILVVLFRSYIQPIIVLLTIPLAYMGVVWGMSLMGRDISLFGLVGIIGLIGIVVNDSLVWVNCYNKLKGGSLSNVSSFDAAIEAVRLRFRPIMLTTITTVFGLMPVALSKSAGIAGSMASTIVSGLFVASILLLVFLPVCIVIIDDISVKLGNMRKEILPNKSLGRMTT